MVHVTVGEPLEVLCRWLAKSGSPVSRWIRKGSLGRAQYYTLRDIAKRDISLVLLWRKLQLRIYTEKISCYIQEKCLARVRGVESLEQVLHRDTCVDP